MKKFKSQKNNYWAIRIEQKLNRAITDLSIIKSILLHSRSESDSAASRIKQAAELIREMSEKEKARVHTLYGE